MELLKMDQKGRIQISKRVRRLLKIRSGQAFMIKIEGNEMRLSKPSKQALENDIVLKDMIERPLHLKKGVKLTKKLLDSLEEGTWLS